MYRSIVIATNVRTVTRTLTKEIKFKSLQKTSLNNLKKKQKYLIEENQDSLYDKIIKIRLPMI